MTQPSAFLLMITFTFGCFFQPADAPSASDTTESLAPETTEALSMGMPSNTMSPSGTTDVADPTGSTGLAETTSSAEISTGVQAACGNSIIETGEECDDGNGIDGDSCTNQCKLASCGDGTVGPGEACDDGDSDDLDECRNDCTFPSCGDGLVQAGENCDDGNNEPGDLCSPVCTSTAVVDVAIGGDKTCVVFDSGTARCWGDGAHGQLGTESINRLGDNVGELPVADIPLGMAIVDMAAGPWHTCALTETGSIYCFGKNTSGQLGHGTTKGSGDQLGDFPPPAVGLGGKAIQLSLGIDHACALMDNRKIRCWGEGGMGQLGYGNSDDLGDAPSDDLTNDVPGVTLAKQVAAGGNFTCTLLIDGRVFCWGHNVRGQLGLGHTTTIRDDLNDALLPTHVLKEGEADEVVHLSLGHEFACARLMSGNVRCWGHNFDGQCGVVPSSAQTQAIGNEPGEMPPPNVNIMGKALEIVTGTNHACVLLESGKIKCWGWGTKGRLGYGSLESIGDEANEMPPPDLPAAWNIKSIHANWSAHTCVLDQSNALRCWGFNQNGQLGYGHVNVIGDDETAAVVGPVPF